MSRWQRVMTGGVLVALVAAGTVAALTLALPARGLAANAQQSILQDDDQLIYSPPQHVVRTLQRLKSLGVDVVKVSLVWWLVAPRHNSSHRPHFNATDPAAYPWGSWNRYDLLAEQATRLGLRLYFQLTPPNPRWSQDPHLPRGQGNPLGQAPKPKEFEQFVQAVGRRYSGRWHGTSGETIPRVSYWGIWNEPNWRGWLHPWHRRVGGIEELTQPPLYRNLVNAAWKGLSRTGHGSDTILIGETANTGSVRPRPFVEDLYCVGPRYHPLTGRAARTVGCPTSGNRSSFMRQFPGLFHITGYAHHPYGFNVAPDKPKPDRTEITLHNIGSLERTMNRIFAGYHSGRRGGIPLYLTEWGYVTNPPNPAYTTSPAQQAVWLDQGEYITWREPFIRALAQFLLVDVKPTQRSPSLSDWKGTFTSGLMFHNGKPKPGLQAYRLPIWLPVARHGSRVTVWGQLRPADHSGTQHGLIEFKRRGSSHWRVLHHVQTQSREGFLITHVSIGSPGMVRLAWVSPGARTFVSRSVTVR